MKLLNIILFSLLLIGQDVSAAGFSSSSRSFSSSSSRSFSSSSRPSAPVSRPSAPAPTRSFTSSSGTAKSSPYSAQSGAKSIPGKSWAVTPQTSTRPTSNVDAARYKSAVTSGKAFTTRDSAVADFKSRNATRYSSTFTSEPTKRPDYIPAVTNVGGTRQTIIYDNNSRGYGYWSGGGPSLGTFMLYDALSDAAMTNTLMARNNYYVGPPVVGTSWFAYFFYSLIGVGFIVIIAAIIAAFVAPKHHRRY